MSLLQRGLLAIALLATAGVFYVGVTYSSVAQPNQHATAAVRRLERLEPAARSARPPPPELPTVVSAVVEARGSLDPRELEASGPPRTFRSISCPSFSGPGYDKRRHPSRTISIPALAAPYEEPAASSARAPRGRPRRLQPVPLSDVRLLPGSAFERAFATNLQFLRSTDVASLLLSWRLAAARGWSKGALRLMGWEHTGSELRGHFLGHWLSAAAFSYAAATHDEPTR